MTADWYLPSINTAQLTVGVARAEIVDFRVPPAAEVGEIIGSTTEPLAIGVRNIGSLAGSIPLRIRDLDGSTLWIGSITLAVNEYGWIYPAINYPMPNRDFRLRAEAYHNGVIDSYQDKTITLIVQINTGITVTLVPASVEPGGVYRYTGKLKRVDTGAGLGGMTVIARREGVEVGRGTTDSVGNYDITATAPTTIGVFNCQAAFPGVIPFAASTAQANLGIGIPAIDPVLVVAGAFVLGVALIAVTVSN